MPNHGARTGRRTLASTSWLLVLVGLSCKYNVTLPWVPPVDGSVRTPDVSFDQALSVPPDAPGPPPDARVCPGSTSEWPMWQGPAPQIIVAIDRSASMQSEFESGTSKAQAVSSALSAATANHPSITFQTIWFPGIGTSCAASTCCASISYNPPGGRGGPDASSGCGPFDAGCLPAPKDSPSHQALKLANTNFTNNTWWAWTSTLVLITDQDPSCAGESDYAACEYAKNYANAMLDRGVRTFVLFPNADGRNPIPDCLTGIAKQNARSFPDAQQPIPAKSPAELRSQLDAITKGLEEETRCRFYPPKEMPSQDQIEQIKINGVGIPYDESGKTGWKMATGAIVLSPVACKDVPVGDKDSKPPVTVVVCGMGHGSGSYGN